MSEAKNNHPKTIMLGKVKTTLLSIALILVYIPKVDKYLILMISIVTFMFQIIAFVRYREEDAIEDKKRNDTND